MTNSHVHSSYSYSNQSFESKKTARMGGLFAHILQKYNKREKGMAAVLMPCEKFPHIRAMMDYAKIPV